MQRPFQPLSKQNTSLTCPFIFKANLITSNTKRPGKKYISRETSPSKPVSMFPNLQQDSCSQCFLDRLQYYLHCYLCQHMEVTPISRHTTSGKDMWQLWKVWTRTAKFKSRVHTWLKQMELGWGISKPFLLLDNSVGNRSMQMTESQISILSSLTCLWYSTMAPYDDRFLLLGFNHSWNIFHISTGMFCISTIFCGRSEVTAASQPSPTSER